MTAMPPNLSPPVQQPEPETSQDKKNKRPETIQALILVWSIAIGGELIHQLIQIISAIVDPTALRQAATEKAESGEESTALNDAVINLSVYMSIAVMALITLAMVGLMTWMLVLFARQHKWAGYARRLLYLFSFFFAFRMLLVFVTTSAASDIPVWLIAIDGALQIVIAVAAICGIIFAGREDTIKWTGEDKELEKFLAAREEKQREKEQKKNDKSGKGN